MQVILETKRLRLAPVSEDERDILHQIFTDDFVGKYLFDNEVLSLEQTADFLKQSEKTFAENGYGLWLLTLKETCETVGFVGLWHFFDENQPQLLYALLPEFTQKGLASEASKAVIDYGFSNLGFEYLIASCDVPNSDSHKVTERIGMKKFKEETINGKPIVFFKIEKSSK